MEDYRMSKWIKGKQELFEKFKEQKKKEVESQPAGPRRSDITWKTPEKGTIEKPKNYQGRLLMDPNDEFYKSYGYHMYKKTDGKWAFALCPKTYGMENYCPVCAAVTRLYKGNKDDKKLAYQYKRKTKHIVNFYIIKDPRDVEAESEDEKNTGKVLVYDCPTKIESKIRQEMGGDEYSAGIKIFDPGKDGYDFIVSVTATKPQDDGKVWPDYSNSKFVPANKPLGTDEEIEKIMEQRHSLEEYIKVMERTDEELLQMVKDEMLYELIEQDYSNTSPSPRTPTLDKKEDMDDVPWKDDNTEKAEPVEEKKSDISDQDLLKDLEGL